MTWEQFCANYTPGWYANQLSINTIQRAADELEHMLAIANWRLGQQALERAA